MLVLREPDGLVTDLLDLDQRLAHGGADSGELCLGLRDGLPQLSSTTVGLIHLPSIHLHALPLELQQHPVPRALRLADLVPDVLITNKPDQLRPPRPAPNQIHRGNRRGREAYLKLEQEGTASRLHLKE